MDLIKIDVSGPTGVGKTHVMNVIKRALEDEYGMHAQVASFDLAQELAGRKVEDLTPPRVAEVVFVLTETNEGKCAKPTSGISSTLVG